MNKVLNHITWIYKVGKHRQAIKENLRLCIFTQLLLEKFLYENPIYLFQIVSSQNYNYLPRIYNYIDKI